MAKRSRFTEYQNRYANYTVRTDRRRHPVHAVPHRRRQPGVELAGARRHVRRVRRYRRRPRDQGADPHRYRRELQRQLGQDAQRRPRRKACLPADARYPRACQARREGLVCTASDHQCARRRRPDDQRGQRPVQHALRGPADGRHRAGLRGRLLPGRLALSPRPGARRRAARHLELPRRPHPRALLPADGSEAQRARGQGVGRRQRGAAQGPIAGSRMGAGARTGQAASADAAVHTPAVHQSAQAGVPRRARPRAGPRDLRAARILPVRRRDGTARPAMGPGAAGPQQPANEGARQ